MKIGLFTDPHYCRAKNLGNRKTLLSYEKIKTSMGAFRDNGVELCICLGDLIDCAPNSTIEDTRNNLKSITDLIKSYKIPYYIVPGNHDYLQLSSKEYEEIIGKTFPPYTIDTKAKRLIFLDANFRSDMRKFDVAGVEWTDSNLPPDQVEYLRKNLLESNKECIIFVHENLDPNLPESHVVKNSEEIRKIIESSGKVKLVIQGHYHEGADNIVNGIEYLTLPAMCETDENYYKVIEI